MDSRISLKLEFNEIKKRLAQKAQSESAKKLALSLEPQIKRRAVKHLIDERGGEHIFILRIAPDYILSGHYTGARKNALGCGAFSVGAFKDYEAFKGCKTRKERD